MQKHVRKMLNAQRDILSPQAVSSVEAALRDVSQARQGKADEETLKKQMANLETAANKWLKPYPHAGIRENVEVLLVALAVAMSIRTFFLQPFKIPTGSMQPTLFGVTPERYSGNQYDLKIPGPVKRFLESWIQGNSYYNITAPEDGELQRVNRPQRLLLFNLKQEYEFNNKWYTVWFPADELFDRAGYRVDYNGSVIDAPPLKAGEPLVKLKVVAGDHLFVDRMSYNFRHPKRGEIIVFETRGINGLPQDQFYIKRLVALGGERVQLGKDRHLVIDGKRLDATTPHFEKVYSFDPATPPMESQFSGHVDGPRLAPLFTDSPDGVVQVRTNHYMVMGDNTMNSLDSRAWGDFPRENVIGKYLFVYWPFSERFGWNAR
ncbi:MAG: Signal peptidase [Pedosphaera sp.]|nr:Signal peptidase [Pedosphaera sp.]